MRGSRERHGLSGSSRRHHACAEDRRRARRPDRARHPPSGRGHHPRRHRGGRQVRRRGARPPERGRRSHRLEAGRRQGRHPARLEGGLPAVLRWRLGRPAGAGGVGRPEPAQPGVDGRRRDLELGQPGVRAVPAAHVRRHRRHRAAGQRAPQEDLPAEDGVGRMDRHHEPHRAARRLRPRRAHHARREAGRRHLPHLRHQDLHHLRRPRDDRQHHPSRLGPPARRPARHARHLAVPGPQVSRQQGRHASARATTSPAPASSTSSASMPAPPP